MKKVMFIFALIMSLTTFAQETKYQTTVTLDSTGATFKKADLFANALEWTATTFKSAQNVIQMSDKESGKLILKCNLSSKPTTMGTPAAGSTHCTIDIVIKDGKYRITFTDIAFVYYSGPVVTYQAAVDGSTKGMAKKTYARFVEDLDNEIKELTSSFNKSMNKKSDF